MIYYLQEKATFNKKRKHIKYAQIYNTVIKRWIYASPDVKN